MKNQYILKGSVLYKQNDKGQFISVCVIPKRIKKLEEAVQYSELPAASEGMSIYNERNY